MLKKGRKGCEFSIKFSIVLYNFYICCNFIINMYKLKINK